jgi:hypothetical protein
MYFEKSIPLNPKLCCSLVYRWESIVVSSPVKLLPAACVLNPPPLVDGNSPRKSWHVSEDSVRWLGWFRPTQWHCERRQLAVSRTAEAQRRKRSFVEQSKRHGGQRVHTVRFQSPSVIGMRVVRSSCSHLCSLMASLSAQIISRTARPPHQSRKLASTRINTHVHTRIADSSSFHPQHVR